MFITILQMLIVIQMSFNMDDFVDKLVGVRLNPHARPFTPQTPLQPPQPLQLPQPSPPQSPPPQSPSPPQSPPPLNPEDEKPLKNMTNTSRGMRKRKNK